MKSKPPKKQVVVRCAIYTRKSSEEGLDQAFNSLDAQRESAEAYIKSQSSEGWVCLPENYSDGGFTGGNMERPGLRQLMIDIEGGKVDTVVVYKVDRLSRSLIDFARMMEAFEKHKVSFVSVTQRFSTADSMGRLTLNMLLSFAQFEREIISERTRDKIAAARRKGKWSGGHPILGYDIDARASTLVVNEEEAEQVRQIFRLYLKGEGLVATLGEVDRQGLVTKRWNTRKGTTRGGQPFNKGRLYLLLTNVAYLGKVRHKENVYEGEHDAIVPEETFQQVQDTLTRLGRAGGGRGGPTQRYQPLLKGLLQCAACECAMVHTYAKSRHGNVRYRYYVCAKAMRHGYRTCLSKSVQAEAIEEFVCAEACKRKGVAVELSALTQADRLALLERVVSEVYYDGACEQLRITFRTNVEQVLEKP